MIQNTHARIAQRNKSTRLRFESLLGFGGMKVCSRCGGKGPFNSNKAKSYGLSSYCTKCQNEVNQHHYKNNVGYYVEKARRRRETLDKLILEAKDKPCADCQNHFNSWQLQFDHMPGTEKRFILSSRKARTVSVESLLAEIAKCEVVCANCHANRTHERNRALVA